MQELKEAKQLYLKMKIQGKEARFSFLDGIVEYCKCIGFTYDKTMMMLAVIRGLIPQPYEKDFEITQFDDIDSEYNMKMLKDKMNWTKD
jgi:hypothetical protein